MSQCKWCSRSWYLLLINFKGLCAACNSLIERETESKLRIINKSRDIINKSNSLDAIICCTNICISNLKDFLKYEIKEIEPLIPFRKLIIEIVQNSNERLMDIMLTKHQRIIDKERQSTSNNKKFVIYDKFISEACDLKNQIFVDDNKHKECLSKIDSYIVEMESRKSNHIVLK